MLKHGIVLISLWFIFGFINSNAQDTTSFKLKYNKVILKHYSRSQLNDLKLTDSLKYNTILYYYNDSYILTQIPCTECVAFDINNFDVSWVEKLRKKTTRVEYTFDKYGIKVLLLSIDELVYKLPIHQ